MADFDVSVEEIPLAEQERPISDAGIDKGESVGAGVLPVRANVEEILEKPERGKGQAVGLPFHEEDGRAEERNEKFAECATHQHDRLAAPTEGQMAGFVDHEIDKIGKEETGFVAEGVEKEKRVGNEPSDAADAGDAIPRLGFAELHEARAAGEPWIG